MCALSDGTNCVRDTAKFAECWQILMKARSKFTIKVVTDSLSPWKTNFDVLPSQMGFERTFDRIPCRVVQTVHEAMVAKHYRDSS